MGKSWLFFKNYEWCNYEERIILGEEEDIGLTYRTTANLCAIFGHYGMYFPTIDVLKGEDVDSLKESLVEPQKVIKVVVNALKLLENEDNPIIDDFGEDVRLFDEQDLKSKDVKKLNENVRYYLDVFEKFSKKDKYIAIGYE